MATIKNKREREIEKTIWRASSSLDLLLFLSFFLLKEWSDDGYGKEVGLVCLDLRERWDFGRLEGMGW